MISDEEIADLKRKLDQVLRENDASQFHTFDVEEVKKLRRLMLFLDRIESLGFFAKYAFWALLMITPVLSNWDFLLEWLRGK